MVLIVAHLFNSWCVCVCARVQSFKTKFAVLNSHFFSIFINLSLSSNSNKSHSVCIIRMGLSLKLLVRKCLAALVEQVCMGILLLL